MQNKNPVRNAILALSDESVFIGYSKGYNGNEESAENIYQVGEVIFNTTLTGYQEVITDPSYHSQIITFTCPHIGNTGINPLDEEADTPLTAGIVARSISTHCSNWRARETLPAYLQARKIIAVDEIDTRAVSRRLRDQGALGGCLMVLRQAEDTRAAAAAAVARAAAFAGLRGARLADVASCRTASDWADGEWRQQGDCYMNAPAAQRRVTVLDCGVKRNILRALTARGCRVRLLPFSADYQAIRASQPDGVLISNGPGDPSACGDLHTVIRQLLAEQVPLFGLCLGHQIIAEALQAKTEKMKFGHHGANHPVYEESSGRVLITSQNHGFAVRAESLPPEARVTYRSLFDNSLQGFAMDTPPVMTFQGHPEASPGPQDAGLLFGEFVKLIDARRRADS